MLGIVDKCCCWTLYLVSAIMGVEMACSGLCCPIVFGLVVVFVSHVHCFDPCLIFRLTKSQRAKQQGPLHDRHDFIHVSHLTNGFHVALRLFGNRSQMTSSKDEKVVHEAISECVTDVLTAFWSTSSVTYYWTEARQHGIYIIQTTSDKAFLFQNLSTSLERQSLPTLKNTKKPSDVMYCQYKMKQCH